MGEGLQDKLAAVLFQLHPGISYTQENLDRIIEILDPLFNNVIEFRHESWWDPVVYDVPKSERISFAASVTRSCPMRSSRLLPSYVTVSMEYPDFTGPLTRVKN